MNFGLLTIDYGLKYLGLIFGLGIPYKKIGLNSMHLGEPLI
jgi:hypothetical protein